MTHNHPDYLQWVGEQVRQVADYFSEASPLQPAGVTKLKEQVLFRGLCGHDTQQRVSDFISGTRLCASCSRLRLNTATPQPDGEVDDRLKRNTSRASLKLIRALPFLKSLDSLTEDAYLDDARLEWQCGSHEWTDRVSTVLRLAPTCCPICFPRSASASESEGEREMRRFIRTLTSAPVLKDRTVLGGLELDAYLPDLGVAVEFNGEHWHSDHCLDGDAVGYHQRKLNGCRDASVSLAFVWDTDWRDSRPAVEEALRRFINSRGADLDPLLMRLHSLRDAD